MSIKELNGMQIHLLVKTMLRESVMILLGGFVCLMSMSADAAEPSAPQARIVATATHPVPDEEASGRTLFLRHCAPCHGEKGIGDGFNANILLQKPADLTRPDLWKTYDDDELIAKILFGRGRRLRLDAEEIERAVSDTDELYRFLRLLPSIDWQAAETGMEIFFDRCLDCHDAYGRPQQGLLLEAPEPRDLSDPTFLSSRKDHELAEGILHKEVKMPPFDPPLLPEEIESLLAWVRILSPGFRSYDTFCVHCHGPYGEGTGEPPFGSSIGPDFAFDETFFATRTEPKIRNSIRHMLNKEGSLMPHFADTLTPEEVLRTVRFLRQRNEHPSGMSN